MDQEVAPLPDGSGEPRREATGERAGPSPLAGENSNSRNVDVAISRCTGVDRRRNGALGEAMDNEAFYQRIRFKFIVSTKR